MSKKTRMKFRDAAFPYRMGAGFPGDVNRTHPASIEPSLVDSSAPPTLYGEPVLIDATTQGARKLSATDQAANDVYGFVVRPYPLQAPSATNYGAVSFGTGSPPTTGSIDVLRTGYIMSNLNTGSAAPVKGGRVYVWIAASIANHTQGGLESAGTSAAAAVAGGGNTGNGTISAVTSDPDLSKPGDYTVEFTAATAFNVYDPDGYQLKPGATGTAYSDQGIGFTITAGATAFVAGDTFTITNTMSTLKLPVTTTFNGPADASGVVEVSRQA